MDDKYFCQYCLFIRLLLHLLTQANFYVYGYASGDSHSPYLVEVETPLQHRRPMGHIFRWHLKLDLVSHEVSSIDELGCEQVRS